MPRYCLAGDVYLHAPGGSRRVAPAVILYLLAPCVLPLSGRFAADPRRRRSLSFAVEHDEPPDLGLERLSVSTRQKDAGVGHGLDDKQHFYAACGVREYWLYGPEGYRTDGGPVLQGCRLHAQAYREIAPVPEGALWWSDELQTHWGLSPPRRHRVSGLYAQLRVRDPESGTWYAAEHQRIRERRQDKARLAAPGCADGGKGCADGPSPTTTGP